MSATSPPRGHGSRLGTVLAVAALVVLASVPAVAVAADERPDNGITEHRGESVVTAPSSSGYGLPSRTVASLFPTESDRSAPARSEAETEVVDLSDERAHELFDALAAETARDLLVHLLEDPHTVAELAEDADTSLQNVHYHVEKLREAGAVAEVDVEYSTRGREMSVYAATTRPQLLVYGDDAETAAGGSNDD